MKSTTFFSIDSDDFETEIIKENGALLLACIHWSGEYRGQMKVLEVVAKQFNGTVKFCHLEKDLIERYRKQLGIEGTPTFLFFKNGKEKSRMLGQVNEQTLSSFVMQNLI